MPRIATVEDASSPRVPRPGGHRPMTPNGVPLVGPTCFENLWLNTGHGTLGWTMSCGSARVIADQISGRVPAVSLHG